MERVDSLDPIAEELDLTGLESALRVGYRINGFSSGGGLRVIRVENPRGKLAGYGEAPQVEDALKHANISCSEGLSFEDLYGSWEKGTQGRFPHYLTGTQDLSSALDAHLQWGHDFEAFFDGETFCAVLGAFIDAPTLPDELFQNVDKTGVPEILRERGITYIVYKPDSGPGVTFKVVENPENKPAYSYEYTQTGRASSLIGAIKAAFSAERIET